MFRCVLCERELSDEEPFGMPHGQITCFDCMSAPSADLGVAAFIDAVLDEIEPDDTEDA